MRSAPVTPTRSAPRATWRKSIARKAAAPRPTISCAAPISDEALLLHSVVLVFLHDAGVDALGLGNVGIPDAGLAFLQFGHAAAVERRRHLGTQPQRRVEVGNGAVELAELEIGKAAAVERVGVIEPQPDRLVAVRDRLLRLPHDRAGPAAVVESLGVFGIAPDGFGKIRVGAGVIAVDRVGAPTLVVFRSEEHTS